MAFNYIDLIALAIIIFYLVSGYFVGMWRYVVQVVSLVAGVCIALIFYTRLSSFIVTKFSLQPIPASAVAYITLMIGVSLLVSTILKILLARYKDVFTEHWYTRIVALIPAFIEALISIALLILVSPLLPLSTQCATQVSSSYTEAIVTQELPGITHTLNAMSGGKLSAALVLLNTPNDVEDGSVTHLSHRPATTSIDTADEQQMLVLVNGERAKVGAPALTMDPALTAVAEAHSQDMWDRQYFAHVNPDGADPFMRMQTAGISFLRAGENIALAPSLSEAHTGLMNSPGHRRNILDPNFHKVGIGIIDGGIYGKMFTQDFTD